jgi:hypothetical protein
MKNLSMDMEQVKRQQYVVNTCFLAFQSILSIANEDLKVIGGKRLIHKDTMLLDNHRFVQATTERVLASMTRKTLLFAQTPKFVDADALNFPSHPL